MPDHPGLGVTGDRAQDRVRAGRVEDEPERRRLAGPGDVSRLGIASTIQSWTTGSALVNEMRRPLAGPDGDVGGREPDVLRASPTRSAGPRVTARSAATTVVGEPEAQERDHDEERAVADAGRPDRDAARAGARAGRRRRAAAASSRRPTRYDSAIAPAASAGLSSTPNAGYRTPIAIGIRSTL